MSLAPRPFSMRPDIESLTDVPSGDFEEKPSFLAPRWAVGLAAVLLLGLAVATAARWWEAAASPSGGPEAVIQQPVPTEPFPAGARSDSTAPDPGDNPPP